MKYAFVRQNMVESQLRTNQIVDAAVIGAMRTVPRELFVPKPLRGIAYLDESVDLGAGRALMEPLAFACMVQAAAIGPADVVLDVGCATGYSAAVLSRLASAVVALESDIDMATRTSALLGELKIDNVAVVPGPFIDGDAQHGPYQVIVVEGAVARIPEKLLAQLAPGGRLVTVLAMGTQLGHITVVARVGDGFSRRTVGEATVPALPGFQAKAAFIF
jgi:protein-L-isoaspartate(D-aspartate) O-methyltransferase